MPSTELDALDRKILIALQADGRASNVELSAQVHLSAPQCFRRVRALEERGVIRGYRAQVQAEALGLGVTAYVSLNIDGGQFGRPLVWRSAVPPASIGPRCSNDPCSTRARARRARSACDPAG